MWDTFRGQDDSTQEEGIKKSQCFEAFLDCTFFQKLKYLNFERPIEPSVVPINGEFPLTDIVHERGLWWWSGWWGGLAPFPRAARLLWQASTPHSVSNTLGGCVRCQPGSMSTPPADMFHEKQHLMHCAIHTLNNLFQEPWASAPLMEDLAGEL